MKINKLTPNSNLRWESSRMMLPEHVEAINRHNIDKLRIKQPVLDEQEIEEIGRKLGNLWRITPQLVFLITKLGLLTK